jgi:hypothetical protein
MCSDPGACCLKCSEGRPRASAFLALWAEADSATEARFSASSGPSSLNTESTENLRDLRVEALLCAEDTEALLTRGEIFACREEADY